MQIEEPRDIFENIEILIGNTMNNKRDLLLINSLSNCAKELLPIGVYINSNLTIKENSKSLNSYYKDFFENIELFGFTKEDLDKYKNGFLEIFYMASVKKYGVEIDFDLNINVKYQLKLR